MKTKNKNLYLSIGILALSMLLLIGTFAFAENDSSARDPVMMKDSVISQSSKELVSAVKLATPANESIDTTLVKGTAVIHISQDNHPPLFYKELPESTGGTVGTFLWSLVGLVIVYVLSWQEKVGREKGTGNAESFNTVIWIKHNLIFFMLYMAAFAMFYWNVGAMHPTAAIALGFAAPKIIEQLRKRFGSTS